ncbi:MAG: patatin-like phospholipase family protein [Hyphomicrobiales bacterium]|nr:patatin-like phospholipase family protein [Hyphomicrobiales bacterium]
MSIARRFRGPNGHVPAGPENEPEERRPRSMVGVALGGGAARGWAHIGVLRALEEAGIVPDIIAGTSIGALVGGCYLAGKLDELEHFARKLSKRKVFSLLDFSFSGSGLISGQRLSARLEEDLRHVQIEDLDRKFIAVATELGTGHEIWMSRGNLVEAMRASYALPGIFPPVRANNRWLVDGALVNPVPVSVCRAFGARVVIAINLHSDVFGRGTVVFHEAVDDQVDTGNDPDGSISDSILRDARRLLWRQFMGRSDGPPGITNVMFDAFNIIQDRIARSRLAGDPPDVMLGPKLGPIGLFEFHRADEAMSVGYETTARQIEEIRDFIHVLA